MLAKILSKTRDQQKIDITKILNSSSVDTVKAEKKDGNIVIDITDKKPLQSKLCNEYECLFEYNCPQKNFDSYDSIYQHILDNGEYILKY